MSNKKNSIINYTIAIILVLAFALVMFCIPSQVSAEESVGTYGETNLIDIAYIPIAGEFKDGNRKYGAFYLNVDIQKLNSTQYEVTMDIRLITTDYKTDRYYVNRLDYYYYGSDISCTSTGQDIVYSVETKPDGTKWNALEKGLLGHSITMPSKVNSYPVIVENLLVDVTGNNPKLCIALNTIHIIGKALAKDTKINNNNFVILEIPLTLNNNRIIPIYRYMHNYNKTTFITNGRYTNFGGPVPSYWIKEAF